MISHVLDTSAIIALIALRSDLLTERALNSKQGSTALSSIVVHELYFGAHKSTKVQYNLETLRLLLADFPIRNFDQRDAFAAGEIRATLTAKGTPIGPYDVLIAGQAKARELAALPTISKSLSGSRACLWKIGQNELTQVITSLVWR